MFKIILASFLFCTLGFAAPQIQGVGAITIYTSHDVKILADWYQKFGFDIQFDKKAGVYWGALNGGTPYLGIHSKKPHTPKKNSKSVSLVFRVNDFDGYASVLEKKGLKPYKVEPDPAGRFAYYRDPDGNEMTVWGE